MEQKMEQPSVAKKRLGDTFWATLSASAAPITLTAETVEQPKANGGSSCGCGSPAVKASPASAKASPASARQDAPASSCCPPPQTGTKV